MQEPESLQRFRALHKAIGKMGWGAAPENPAPDNSHPLAVQAESFEASAGEVNPAARTRPILIDSEHVRWVPEDAMHDSAVKRAQRIARVRAERELVFERARIVETVNRLRLNKIERQVRDSQFAVVAMEDRLRSGGHTGRLDWMEAQVTRVRGLVTQG